MKKYLLTIATVFALAACSGGGAPTPTGDAEKDAKAVIEFMVQEIKDCKSMDEINGLEDKMKPMIEAFEKYGEENPEYKEKYEKAQQKEGLALLGVMLEKEAELKKK
ncbi:MAG: lipoprotein [Bacteroidales bacterium]|nr:lipoprotein [Bacteroidales bacterium]